MASNPKKVRKTQVQNRPAIGFGTWGTPAFMNQNVKPDKKEMPGAMTKAG